MPQEVDSTLVGATSFEEAEEASHIAEQVLVGVLVDQTIAEVTQECLEEVIPFREALVLAVASGSVVAFGHKDSCFDWVERGMDAPVVAWMEEGNTRLGQAVVVPLVVALRVRKSEPGQLLAV